MQIPEGLKYWTADEVAEVLSGLESELRRKLWSFLNEAENPTPSGGDGGTGLDGRVTVESPDARMDLNNDDKAVHWWSKLNEHEQMTIAESYRKEVFG